MITSDEIVEETNTVLTNSTSATNFYILLDFLLTTMALIAVSVYCYLIKYRSKQEDLLSFHIRNNKLKNNLLKI